jgi:hypothetical protein
MSPCHVARSDLGGSETLAGRPLQMAYAEQVVAGTAGLTD